MYWDKNNFYEWTISQKLPLNGFEWRKDTFKFDEGFIKNCDEDSDTCYTLEPDVKFPKQLHKLHSDILFLQKKGKLVMNWNMD